MIPCPIQHAIKCRTEVLSNLVKYKIDEKHRPVAQSNLDYFKKLLKQKELK